MVDSKTQKLSIGEIIIDSELLNDALDHRKMCKNEVEKLPFLIKYVPDRYKTQQMCYKVILKIVEC